MSNERWTPGPWKPHATGRARSGKPEHEIHWSDDGECIAEIVHGEPEAHLIAAAPELYEALNESIKDLVCTRNSARHAAKTDSRWSGVAEILDDRITECRAALAKARGEQHD